jgi:hypothetical protein
VTESSFRAFPSTLFQDFQPFSTACLHQRFTEEGSCFGEVATVTLQATKVTLLWAKAGFFFFFFWLVGWLKHFWVSFSPTVTVRVTKLTALGITST